MTRMKHGGARLGKQARRVFEGLLLGTCAVAAGAAVLLPPGSDADGAPVLEPARPLHLERQRDDSRSLAVAGAATSPGTDNANREPSEERPVSGSAGAPPCRDPASQLSVHINRATQAQLEQLPGIGPRKALDILRWRVRHGPFKRLRDLRRIKGFGRKTVTRLAPYLVVD